MPNPIDIAKDQAVKLILSRIGDMGDVAYDIVLKALEDNFDFKSGYFEVDKQFVKQLNKLTIQVLDLLQSEPKFTGPVSQFVKRMPQISEAITDFQKTQGIAVPAYETAKKVVVDEVIDRMMNNGLNQHFVQPLRNLIYQNATSGISLKDAREQIKDYIKGGKDQSGKLGRYLEQTSIQAVDSYSGIINTKLLEQFDYDGQLITGSLIDNSSPQCRYAIEKLGGKISRDNWSGVEKIAKKNGLIEGTDFDNLPFNRLHWGCRHGFYPIILKKSA